MLRYLCEIIDGHIIVTIDQSKYVIDTGSSISFGNSGGVSINGRTFPLSSSHMGISATRINQLSGLNIDGLIGMNILSNFDLRVTPTAIFFSSTTFPYTEESIEIPIVESIMSVPVIRLQVGNEEQRLYFDTGAKLSYLDQSLLQGSRELGEANDFHPSIGAFTTKTYGVAVKIGEKIESMTFGCLPTPLELVLRLGDTKGILGSEILNRYNLVLSNLAHKIILERK